jgi:hypothetical protein
LILRYQRKPCKNGLYHPIQRRGVINSRPHVLFIRFQALEVFGVIFAAFVHRWSFFSREYPLVFSVLLEFGALHFVLSRSALLDLSLHIPPSEMRFL